MKIERIYLSNYRSISNGARLSVKRRLEVPEEEAKYVVRLKHVRPERKLKLISMDGTI